jgi:primosomal protein N'
MPQKSKKTPPEGKERAEMIDKDGYCYMVVCDNCGDGAEVDTWDEALKYIRDEGWQKKKNGNSWNHYCPECKEEKK